MSTPERRTKRRYAHELYPLAEEGETRPLSVEVPYLYARALGLETEGTGWFTALDRGDDVVRMAHNRTQLLVETRKLAFMADAMLQGLTGDEAWRWADERSWDETGELTCDRAIHYGVPYRDIKPYACGPEPEEHYHYGPPDRRGSQVATYIKGRESDCPDCTEPVGETP